MSGCYAGCEAPDQRMMDERLAEISEQLSPYSCWPPLAHELFNALKAERSKVAELEAENKRAIHCEKCGDSYYDSGFFAGCPFCRIAELEAEALQARQTAEYWKANHQAGNAELAKLREEALQRAETAETETDHLMDALIQQENVLNDFVRLLNEALDDEGTDTDFDNRLADARAKLERLSDWRTRDMLCLQRRQQLQDAEARLAKVRELAEKWRKLFPKRKTRSPHSNWFGAGINTAFDELESLLTDKAGSGDENG